MIILKRGDHLPTVAVLQSFLNQQPGTTQFIEVDGVFGFKTAEAVARVRRDLRLGHGDKVDGEFWLRVVGGDWQVIDSVDRTIPLDPKKRSRHPDFQLTQNVDLAPYGQTVRQQFGQSFGANQVFGDIAASAQRDKVALLRFHGHGGPGGMIVSAGMHNNGSFLDHRVAWIFVAPMQQLGRLFGPFASIELHGCRVAQGVGGRQLLKLLADASGVPVSAGIGYQYGDGPATTFRFEGPTRTACPGGISIKQWASNVLNVSRTAPIMSVAR